MEAYFAYVNEEEGGVHGRKLKLLIRDDGYDPTRTPAVVEELVDGDRVFALLGGNGTANCLAVKDYIAIKLLPWINPGSGARVWTSPMNAYVFSTFPSSHGRYGLMKRWRSVRSAVNSAIRTL